MKSSNGKQRLPMNLIILIAFNLILFITLSSISPTFFTSRNISSLMLRMSELAMLALAETVVLIGGGMDLTVGAVMALSGSVCGMLFQSGLSPISAISIAIICGSLAGVFNGFLVVHLRIQSFIATVATNSIFRSIVYLMLKGRVLSSFPREYVKLGSSMVGGIPLLFILVLIVAFALHFLINKSEFGRSLYAVGSNAKCAHISGIHVNHITYVGFIISGFLSSIGGIMYTMRIGAIIPDAGLNSPLEVITAVLIGGASVKGGKGSITGSLLGILAMYLLLNGFSLLGLNPFWEVVVLGIALITIVGQGNKKKVIRMRRFAH